MNRELEHVLAQEAGMRTHLLARVHALVPELEGIDAALLQRARRRRLVADDDREEERAHAIRQVAEYAWNSQVQRRIEEPVVLHAAAPDIFEIEPIEQARR